MSWDRGAGSNQVFVDGKMMNDARWPNSSLDLSHPTLATASSATATISTATISTITSAALAQPAGFWVGATISIDSGDAWVFQSGTVTASSPGSLTFSYTADHPTELPLAGNKFFLTGVAGALDTAGEWFRASNGTLSLWTPAGDSPANHVVEAKARQFGFDLSNAAYIHIQGIHLFACTINTSGVSRGVVINQITAEYLSQFAVPANGWIEPTDSGIVLKGNNDTLSNSVLAYSAGDGVFVSGYGSRITNNIIHDVDILGGNCAGVRIGVANVSVDHNTIYNAGRSGVCDFSTRDQVTYNVIHDFGLQTTDCGGVYTIGLDGQGAVIAYNTVYNGITAGYGAAGLYLDNNSSGFIVDHNITYNVNTGLKMNVTSIDNTIVNNTLDATQHSVDKTWGTYDWSGTIIENNIFTHATSFGVNATILHNVIANGGAFMNMTARNYQLSAGSSAIGAGMSVAPYTHAFGAAAPDAGALPYGTTPFADGAVVSLLPADPSAAAAPPIATPPVITPPPVVSSPPTAGVTSATNATSSITALNFTTKHGSAAESLGGLGYNFGGDWVDYSNIDFGSGVSQVTFQFAVANAFAGKQIILASRQPDRPNDRHPHNHRHRWLGNLHCPDRRGHRRDRRSQPVPVHGRDRAAMGNIQSFSFS